MTTTAFSPAPTYTISGIGPYDVPFTYEISEQIQVSVLSLNEAELTLTPSDY